MRLLIGVLVCVAILFFLLPVGLADQYIVEVSTSQNTRSFHQGSNVMTSKELLVVEGDLNTLQKQYPGAIIEPDYPISLVGVDQNYPFLNASIAHSENVFGNGITVAVLDTGINKNLIPVASEFDFVNNDNDASDDEGHGTGVASIIGASQFDSIAPHVDFMSLKVLDDEGNGLTSSLLFAIDYATQHNADIITLSLGSANPSVFLEQRIETFVQAGGIVIAASGNTNGPVLYPAKYDSVFAVGAVDHSGSKTGFSNHGPELDFTALGVNVPLLNLHGQTVLGTGTSFSAPQITGIAALYLSSGVSSNALKETMIDNALDLGVSGFDTFYGYGVPQFVSQARCDNRIQDGDEEGVDCGGSCVLDVVDMCDGIDNNFDCLLDEDCDECELDIVAPLSQMYDSRRVPFNMTLPGKGMLRMHNLNDKRVRNRTLCRACDEYGDSRNRLRSFKDGEHHIEFFYESEEEMCKADAVFEVDSKTPRFIQHRPGKYCNGTFVVHYIEEYPRDVGVIYGEEEVHRSDCPSGRASCVFDVDLEDYEGEEIAYQFVISDHFRTAEFKEDTCIVDTTPPEIFFHTFEVSGNYVYMNISLSEKGRLWYELDGKLRQLCSNCASYGFERFKRKRFGIGEHELSIVAEDKAGFITRVEGLEFVIR